MKKKFFAAAILLVFICVEIQAQQAWTSPKGKFFTQIGYTPHTYYGIIVGKDVINTNRASADNNVVGYFQYGITDRLMGTVIAPFNISSSKLSIGTETYGLTDGTLAGFSNIQTALTYRFLEKNGIVFSGKLNVSLPTATYDAAKGLRTGDDCTAFEPSLLVGLGRAKYFASAEIGFGYRTNNYSSQNLFNAQIGKFFGKKQKFLVIFNPHYRLSNNNGSRIDGNTKYTVSFLNNQSYLAYGIKFGYKITDKWMIWSSVRGAVNPPTKDIGANQEITPGLSFAVSYQN